MMPVIKLGITGIMNFDFRIRFVAEYFLDTDTEKAEMKQSVTPSIRSGVPELSAARHRCHGDVASQHHGLAAETVYVLSTNELSTTIW